MTTKKWSRYTPEAADWEDREIRRGMVNDNARRRWLHATFGKKEREKPAGGEQANSIDAESDETLLEEKP